MNGAEILVGTLTDGGIHTCFTNPGTSEMHIVAALDRGRGIRCVLGLFEGVVTGAADGYARMAGEPACTLLHLGPGLGNGLANLHNATRARVPIINIVGQHPAQHLRYDPPLASDIEGIARPYSKWLRTSRAACELGRDTAEAIASARTPPGQIATLIVPADVAWSDGGSIGYISSPPVAPMPTGKAIERAAAMLRSGVRTALLLAGDSLYGEGLRTAGRIAGASGAKLVAPYPFTRIQRGAGRPVVQRMAYVPEQATEQLREFSQIILVGASAPVSYFAYPGKRSELVPPGCEIHTLATESEDCSGALARLAEELGPSDTHRVAVKSVRTQEPSGEITLSGLALAIAAVLPENAIVADESMTSGRGIMAATQGAPPHDWVACTGGSIGIAMPLAVGAAVACPDRPVLCLTADGSGMYTAQALWTMAREGLNVATVVFANRAYAVLKREFLSLGVGEPGACARNLFEIDRPELDWVSLAKGMGVPAKRVTSLQDFAKTLREGLESGGPYLIEVPL